MIPALFIFHIRVITLFNKIKSCWCLPAIIRIYIISSSLKMWTMSDSCHNLQILLGWTLSPLRKRVTGVMSNGRIQSPNIRKQQRKLGSFYHYCWTVMQITWSRSSAVCNVFVSFAHPETNYVYRKMQNIRFNSRLGTVPYLF